MRWSKEADSLLMDTTKLVGSLDSLRNNVSLAGSDTCAIDAAIEFGAELRLPTGDRLMSEALDRSRELHYGYGEAHAQYCLARVAVHHVRLAEADSLLDLADTLADGQAGNRWGLIRLKIRYTRADLQRYKRNPAGALAGFAEAMTMARKLDDAEWIAACEAALGGTFLSDLKFDSARVHCERCVEMAKRTRDRDRMASCHNFLGEMYRIQKEYGKALEHETQALELAKELNNRGRQAENYYALAETYRSKDDFPRALENYQRSLVLAEAMDMKQVAAVDLLYMGDIHSGFEEYEEALAGYEKGLGVAKAAGLKYIQASCLVRAGRVLGDLHRQADGLSDLHEALAIAETLGNDDLQSNCRNVIGELLQKQGKYEEATTQYDAALELGRKAGDPDERFYSQQMGDVHFAQGNMSKAREEGELALRDARRKNASPLDVALAADLLRKVYRSLGQDGKAMGMLETKVAIDDSVFSAKQLRKLSNLELKAQEEKMNADQEHERARSALAVSAERRRSDMALMGGGSVLLLSLALGLGYRRSRKQARALSLKNAELIKLQEQLVTSEKQREADHVRTRIARDVHDELGSDLTRIALLGNEAKRRSEDGRGALMEVIEQIGLLSREVSASLHDIVWAVDPERDSVQSMIDHARIHAERALDGTGITTDLRFTHTGPDRTIDPATKRDIFLVMKEGLNNVLKYAKAGHVELALVSDDKGFRMLLRDDGVGFDTESAQRSGNGSRFMRSRAQRLGAEFHLESSPGHGTTLELRGPWPAMA